MGYFERKYIAMQVDPRLPSWSVHDRVLHRLPWSCGDFEGYETAVRSVMRADFPNVREAILQLQNFEWIARKNMDENKMGRVRPLSKKRSSEKRHLLEILGNY